MPLGLRNDGGCGENLLGSFQRRMFRGRSETKISEVGYSSSNKVWYIGTLEQRFFRRAVQLISTEAAVERALF